MKIIANQGGIATRQDLQHRQPGQQLLGARARREDAGARAALSRVRARTPRSVTLVDTTADDYYGKGYQDVQNRVPKITNTCADLDWKPRRRDGRRAGAHLRRLSRPGRAGAPARRGPCRRGTCGLALKIDVDTLRGTREGVPTLVELLRKHGVARDVPVLARPRPHRPRDQARVPSGLRRQGAPHVGGQALRRAHAAVRHAAAGSGHRPARRRRDARRARRGPRDRRALLGPHPLAGRRGRRRRRMDVRRDAARVRALHRDLRASRRARTAPPAGR